MIECEAHHMLLPSSSLEHVDNNIICHQLLDEHGVSQKAIIL